MTALSLRQRIDTLEKAYEFFLAYAAQGLTSVTATGKDAEARRHLQAAVDALDGMVAAFRELVSKEHDPSAYETFLDTFEQDVQTSTAVFAIALTQRAVSSQLIDNINASVHVRALLTDLFVLDEALQIPVED